MKRIFSIVFCVCVASTCLAQKIFSGKVFDNDTKLVLPHVYVENITRHTVTESNSSGTFEIYSFPGDTLIFSFIGYYWAKHIVTIDNHANIFLIPQVYEIGAITKYFPYSYEELTQKVLAMKPVEDSLQLNLEHEPFLPVNNHQPGQLSYTYTGAITELYNATNRHARNAIKAAELLSHKENILIINKKFNKAMVVEMTHIPDEYFDRFIAFCNFSDEFLLQTSDFQIIMTICWQYEKFTDLYPELKYTTN